MTLLDIYYAALRFHLILIYYLLIMYFICNFILCKLSQPPTCNTASSEHMYVIELICDINYVKMEAIVYGRVGVLCRISMSEFIA